VQSQAVWTMQPDPLLGRIPVVH
ncbi:MAG: hypothetical protein JWO76_982, partial [Nocardioides sp.]|nr:hypothetical protein [Nocardioides sp.]